MVSSFWAAGQGVQGAHGQHLGLAAGEQAGAVDPGQHAHLGGQGTDLVLRPAVHPVALSSQALTIFFWNL